MAARTLVTQLQSILSDLRQVDPTLFGHDGIDDLHARFKESARLALERLQQPVFSIATIGTTSSGKSTLLNALIGRRLAPMDAGEMSAGILAFRHGDKLRLRVSDSPGGAWAAGDWDNLSDSEVYSHIRDKVMKVYHHGRPDDDQEAPQIEVTAPLLPVLSCKLLGLPPEVGFEIVDLPGIKAEKDRKNLRIIQQRIRRSMPLVVLDYSQTDPFARREILAEVKLVVEQLRGNRDAMVFVLNRVDRRGAEDDPLDLRVQEFEQEIAEVLCTTERPKLLKVAALPVYFLQCGWGPHSYEAGPSFPDSARTEMLKKWKRDCASWIADLELAHPKLKEFFFQLNKSLPEISEKQYRVLLQVAYKYSGVETLWTELAARLRVSFAALVIYPAISDFLELCDRLCEGIKAVIEVRKIDSVEEAKSQGRRLSESHEKTIAEIEARRKHFGDNLTYALANLNEGTPEGQNRAIDRLGPAFAVLPDAVAEVRKELISEVISPVTAALLSGTGIYDIERSLTKSVSPAQAKKLSRAIDKLREGGYATTDAREGRNLNIKSDDPSLEEAFHRAEKDIRRLYQAMREAMIQRAEVGLQRRAVKIEKAISNLLLSELEMLKQAISGSIGAACEEAALNTLVDSGEPMDAEIELPEELFSLPEASKRREEVRREKVGVYVEQVEYTTKTCLVFSEKKVKDIVRDRMKDFSYSILSLPSATEMEDQWAAGITHGTRDLWEKLIGWVSRCVNAGIAKHTMALEKVFLLLRSALDEQLQCLERNQHQELVHLESILASIAGAEGTRSALVDLCAGRTGDLAIGAAI